MSQGVKISSHESDTHTHTHTHTLVVYNTVQYKQWVHTWSICQSNLQILQRKLQHRPGSDTNTPNTQQHTDRTHSATGARGSLQPGFNQVIPLHQRAPWCDVSLTSLTSWRGKPLHQGSSRSVHAAQRYKQYYAHTHTHTHTVFYIKNYERSAHRVRTAPVKVGIGLAAQTPPTHVHTRHTSGDFEDPMGVAFNGFPVASPLPGSRSSRKCCVGPWGKCLLGVNLRVLRSLGGLPLKPLKGLQGCSPFCFVLLLRGK